MTRKLVLRAFRSVGMIIFTATAFCSFASAQQSAKENTSAG